MSSNIPDKFTWPFCYNPHPLIVEASRRLISKIDSSPGMKKLFSEGKMLGIMMVSDAQGETSYLYAFSGLVGGLSIIDGFVPPIFDTASPDSYFKIREAEISAIDADGPVLKARRKAMSEELQDWLFSHYIVSNARGESLSVKEVFARKGLVPPGGTGDCAGPKLLQYAYSHSLKPLAMGEFWYGASKGREVRTHGAFYPSCTGKCGPLLRFMMEGLDVDEDPLERDDSWTYGEPAIVWSDNHIVVADKPSGMLTVPGRSGRISLLHWLSERMGRTVLEVHRLDMDTSGLVAFAMDPQTQSALRAQFEAHTVKKQYMARLCAPVLRDGLSPVLMEQGIIKLPLALDWHDRPRQAVDPENGKLAVTHYRLIRTLPDGRCDVLFTPHTGRTHQLRVSAASSMGLGRPIVGDRLYGGGPGTLMLRATYLRITHPSSGETLELSL